MSCSPRKPSRSCVPRPTSRLVTLAAIVRDYRGLGDCARDRLAYYRRMPSLPAALDAVASWRNHCGKVHAHQRRVSKAAKAGAAERIRKLRVDDVRDFDDLLGCVEKAIGSIRGIGDLAVYDVALHIGAFLKRLPARVYLQAGARKGARTLGIDTGERSLPMAAFPPDLRQLEPWELEDVLCIYKGELGRMALKAA